jgi:hypothetical protein
MTGRTNASVVNERSRACGPAVRGNADAIRQRDIGECVARKVDRTLCIAAHVDERRAFTGIFDER